MNRMRGSLSIVAGGMLMLSVAACGTTYSGPPNMLGQPQQLPPVQQSGAVSSSSLPPLSGSTVATPGQVNPNLTGTPVLGGASQQSSTTMGDTASLDPLAIPGATGMPGSRDLSGGLTVDKLLGGWTVTSGPTQCRLNLTYTAKEGTAHYRASAPGCQIGTLANTAAWALQGSQVQLFDESGSLIAALVLSGNQFIGTVAGGTAITMAG
jgi:hypothetical protein